MQKRFISFFCHAIVWLLISLPNGHSWTLVSLQQRNSLLGTHVSLPRTTRDTSAPTRLWVASLVNVPSDTPSINNNDDRDSSFENFCQFLQSKQAEIIAQIESTLEAKSGQTFSRDAWGCLAQSDTTNKNDAAALPAGGLTRVLQGGDVIEKGACSLTIIRHGTLTAERAASLRARQSDESMSSAVTAGDTYQAAALSLVLHTRSPMVPTFRSDVRIFVVQSSSTTTTDNNSTMAWYGGGADLTPYYLYPEDIAYFHQCYKDVCDRYFPTNTNNGGINTTAFTYQAMKQACDAYFYLPARAEHRGTGGVFFDDMPVTSVTTAFCHDLAHAWMPSWFPIIAKRQLLPYTDQQVQWQRLRRGRYLEFNLLYDRGVKFGLAHANPRVEGVMVSAPPVIAYEYNHRISPGSLEADMQAVLQTPRDWVLQC
jgi:coproporphyrinogen III oxidase